jgi:D-arginine dehydrogenase
VSDSFDFVVIGAGIAGASVAAELQREHKVLLAEMESRPGYHSTGRSAAVFAEAYGPAPIRALTRASRKFYLDPPDGFASAPLLSERGGLFVANDEQVGRLDAYFDELSAEQPVERLNAEQTRALCPLLRQSYVAGGILDPSSMDIDVSALHQGYLAAFRKRGGAIRTSSPVTGLSRSAGAWTVDLHGQRAEAATVINASGAWAGDIGRMAGAIDIGLVPKRRTALIVSAPPAVDPGRWPLTIDIDEAFYLKPDAGRLLVSPANEDPEPPCDIQPDEMDVALCVDRIESAFDLQIRRIESKWAGLRSFVADKSPVCGFDPQADGFFWLAGHGGYGIQSAPALSRAAAALACDLDIPDDILALGLDPAAIKPERLMPGQR